MNHIEGHQHAFLNADNKVINISVFDESAHGSQILEDVKNIYQATTVVCCCDYGVTVLGADWTGTEFIPPMPIVKGQLFFWDDTAKVWVSDLPASD